MSIANAIAEFFDRELRSPQARSPVPEIWPSLRVINQPTEIHMVVPGSDITIHYTVDGSEPSTASPVYDKPFTIEPGTTIRAVTLKDGRRPSRVVSTIYRQGPQPVQIIAPLDRQLPPAVTGQPYSVQFQADHDSVRWLAYGEMARSVACRVRKMASAN